MNGPQDFRNEKKAEDVGDDSYGVDDSQQPAELQVGEEEERIRPERFEPDPRGEPPAADTPDSGRSGR
jgi:hypothetical protein